MDVSFLSKCLPLLFLPVSTGLILIVIAILRRSRKWLIVSLLLGWIVSTPLLADRLMQTLEDQYPYRGEGGLPCADAAFVFGGMLGSRGHSDANVEWNDCADRFEKALSLYRAGKVRTVVLSGGALILDDGLDEGQILQREAIARGVPSAVTLVTPPTVNTEMEAEELRRLTAERRWKKVLVITSAYHMPRAMLLSRECSATLIPVPVAYLTPDPGASWPYARTEYYLPQARALLVSERALREYMGMLFQTLIHVT